MENLLIATGAVAGVVVGGYAAGSMINIGGSLVLPLLGAMIGAVAGGWASSRIIDRLR